MMPSRRGLLLIAAVLAAPAGWTQERADNQPPVIRHTPIAAAVPGQAITIRAAVTDDSGKIKSVTLLCATSRDAAPFRAPMQDVGAGIYVGMIPNALLSGVTNLSYYIEAVDDADATAETPWHTVVLDGGAVAPGESVAAPEKGWSWRKKALVGGGAAVAVGGALVAANAGGGAGGPADNTASNAGTYVGSVTLSLQFAESAPTTTAHAVTFTVISDGVVSSDTLYPGRHLEASIRGGTFEMVVAVSEPDLHGQIRHTGHLFSNRILGSISGTAETSSGTPGIYTGTFDAVKQ